MSCAQCGAPLPQGCRRHRIYCSLRCGKRAYRARQATGVAPQPWRHPAHISTSPTVRAAAERAEHLGDAHGWSASTRARVLDGLAVVLHGLPIGQHVPLTQVRARTPATSSKIRVAEVLADMELLDDDTVAAIRPWIDRRCQKLPAGFAADVRLWLLVLLDGDARTRPRSPATLYVYLGSVEPLLTGWAATHGHLREITTADITTALERLRGWPRRNAITALCSLFRFATRRRIVFTNPTARLTGPDGERNLLPLTDAEVRAVERLAVTPAQRLVIALAAVHAARPAAIRGLTLDDLDLPNRRITLAGHRKRLDELTYRSAQAWLEQRRATWPRTPNRHVLISLKTALGLESVSRAYLKNHLLPGVDLDHIRGDRVLQEALAVGADPLHLALVFTLAHTTASRYATFAQNLLASTLEQGSVCSPNPPNAATASPEGP